MPSPFCTAQDGAGAPQNTLNGANATPGNTVTIALTSNAGVGPWTLVCYGTDETNSVAAVNASLTINSLAKTATFTMPAAGSALLFRSTINNGLGANQLNDPTASTTLGVFSNTAGGLRVGAVNELLESNATYGWLPKLNAAIRGGGGGIVSWAADLAGSTSTSQQVVALSSASIIPVTSGFRLANTKSVLGRNAGGTADIPLIGSDASNNVQLGDPAAAQGALTVLNGTTGLTGKVGATTALQLGLASTDFLALGATPSGSGFLRFGNTALAQTYISGKSAGTDTAILSSDTAAMILTGGGNTTLRLQCNFVVLTNNGVYTTVFAGQSNVGNYQNNWTMNNCAGPYTWDSDAGLTAWNYNINGTTIMSVTPSKVVTLKGIRRALRRVATSTTLTTSDDVVIFSASGQTATLPTSPTVGDKYTIGLDVAGTSNTYAIYTNGVTCVYQGGSSVANPTFTITTAGFTGANNTNVVSLTWTGSVWLMADGY